MASQPNAFWIIRLSSLGDIVVTTSALSWLKAKFPSVPIFFITSQEYAPLFTHDPRITQVFAYNRSPNVLAFIHFIRHVLNPAMRIHGGELIDLHSNLRSRILRHLCPLPTSVIIHKHTLARLFVCTTKIDILNHRKPLAYGIVDQLQQRYGVLPSSNLISIKPKLYPPPSDNSALHQKWKLQPNPSYIGMVPTAMWAGKRWPAAHFIQLIHLIQSQTSYRCIIFGGPRDTYGHDIAKHTDAINTTGQLSLSEVMTLMKHCCKMVIANDTGLMHMADALNIPTCAILGPTTTSMGYPPLGVHSFCVERNIWCRPCSRNGQAPCIRLAQRTCLRDLSPQTVFETCKKNWNWACSG